MKRFVFFLLAFCLMAAGCNEVEIDPQPQTPQIDQKPTTPQTEVRIEINSLDTRSVDLTLSVTSTDMKALDSWGIVYCETSNREQGKEEAAPGKPYDAGQQMTITDLMPDTDYYIWGWAEDKESERV